MRLIDANALIKTLVKACDNDQLKFYPVWIEKQIDAQPTVAILKEQDTKTGYWITEEPNTYTRKTYCSVCSKSAPFVYVSDDYYSGRSHGETKKTKYCPNCGAKMNI